ncbi:MAG: hypothetical protein ABI685_07475 [Ferruginibacter sp.]
MKKNLIIIVIGSLFASPVLAQSTVYDVPANKIKPAYETAPLAKEVKPTPVPLMNNGLLNAHAQPNQQPAAVKSELTVQSSVKEPLPAALKGTSLDPNAKPVIAAAKTPAVNVPARNSGNTQADAAIASIPVENAKAVDAKPATQAVVRPLFNQQATAANTELLQPVEANAATTIQTPEVKIDASRAVPMEEVKPSAEKVTQPKVPVASKQGSGN